MYSEVLDSYCIKWERYIKLDRCISEVVDSYCRELDRCIKLDRCISEVADSYCIELGRCIAFSATFALSHCIRVVRWSAGARGAAGRRGVELDGQGGRDDRQGRQGMPLERIGLEIVLNCVVFGVSIKWCSRLVYELCCWV